MSTTANASNAGSSGLGRALRSYGPPALVLVLLFVVWDLAIRIFDIEVYVFPAPGDVWTAFIEKPEIIVEDGWLTAQEALYGFLLGSIIGIALGVAFAYSRFLSRSFLPLVIASNAIPIIAVAPILLLVLGEGMTSKVAVTAFLCFFPVCINSMKGVASTPVQYVELMHVQAASGWQSFSKVRMPASLPYVFVGLKIGATFAIIGAIVAEFVAAQAGLGNVMVQSNYQLDTPELFAATFVAMVLGIAFYLAVTLAERIVIPWHKATL